jgi:hypothetical protein
VSTANVTIQVTTVPGGTAPSGWPAEGMTFQIPPSGFQGFFSASTCPANPADSNNPFCRIPQGSVISAVASSDQPIAASVNLQRVGNSDTGQVPGTSANPFRVATSAGISEQAGGQIVYASQVPKYSSSFNSKVYVQNMSATSANATLYVYGGTSVALSTKNVTIPPYTSIEYDPKTDAALPDNRNYSMKADSNNAAQKLAMTVNFFNTGADANTSQFQSYNGVSQGSTTLYAPLVVGNFYGFISGMQAQNIGTVNTDITIAFNFNGEISTITYAGVQPNASVGPYMSNSAQVLGGSFPPTSSALTAAFIAALDAPNGQANGFSGSAVVTSTGGVPIVGNVNQDKRNDVNPAIGGVGSGDSYRMIRAEEATTKLAFAQLTKLATNDSLSGPTAQAQGLNAGFVSGFGLQVLGGVAANCNVVFTGPALANPVPISFSIAANGSVSQFMGSLGSLPNGFNGSATVDCGAVKVLGIANLATRRITNVSNLEGVGDSFTFALGIPK